MIPRRWFHRKQSCIINTDLQRWMQCNFYWTERPSGRQNSVKIKIETFISNVFERKVKSCNTSQYLHVGKKFRKEAKVQVQQTVCWSARTKWESFVEYKIPYGELILFTTLLSCISDPGGCWTCAYVKTRICFYRQTKMTRIWYLYKLMRIFLGQKDFLASGRELLPFSLNK